jgi:hypothetical protein
MGNGFRPRSIVIIVLVLLVVMLGSTRSIGVAATRVEVSNPAASASSGPETYIAQCSTGTGSVAPTTWSSGCLAGSANFDNLTWSNWGVEGASATGTALVTDCDPNCLGGNHAEYPARLTALRIHTCKAEPGNSQYLELKTEVEYPPGNGLGQAPGWQTSTWKVEAANCTALIAVPEQGVGVILERRPKVLDASRNVNFPAFSGRDTWVISKWLRFGGPRAVAKATYWWHTPDGSNFGHYKSRVVLSRLGSCGQLHIYTRITGHFVGRKPPGMPRTIVKAPVPAETC